ncbi:MAG: hypothetical protein HUJ96_01395 [Marinilabiliaceae bacterium]|nr:hypothetical protein [Marinilabiliaceae bacterium]
MSIYILFILVLMSLMGSLSLCAQTPKSFSSDEKEFIEQMEAYFKTSSVRNRADAYFKTLELLFENPSTSPELKSRIISYCNLLLKYKSAHPIPEYQNLIETLVIVYGSPNISPSNLAVWNEALTHKMSSRVQFKYINKFLESSALYAKERVLGHSSNAQWRSDAANVTFENDAKGQIIIHVPQSRLVCFSKSDSIEVKDTSGDYLFDEMKWTSPSGRITWERVGLPEEQTFATFGKWSHDMSKTTILIDSVRFMNSDYFNEPLYGSVEHRLVSPKSLHGKNYPKFITTNERREVKQIFQNIDYYGGFAQEGVRMRGSGSPEVPAQLLVYRQDTLFIEVSSVSFILFPNRIESAKAEISIKLDDDEIRHPGLHFTYLDKTREIRMIRLGEGLERSRFFDTYHMVNMDVQQIRWFMDQQYLQLGMLEGAARAYATFESVSYFREEYFRKLMGMNLTHPFQYLADFHHYNGGMPFTVNDYAEFRGMQSSSIRAEIINLSYDGFLDYDEGTDIVVVKERLLDYLKFQTGKKDYDVIRFESDVELTAGDSERVMPQSQKNTPNALLDLHNYDLMILGVKGVSVSDYQNVALRPDNNKILLKRNRDFQFNGQVDAGMLTLFGEGFYFSYDKFNVELKHVDRMCLHVKTDKYDHNGIRINDPVKNMIRDITGYISIDKPDNKSGRFIYEGYPRLVSKEASKVYYDHVSIQGGRYKKDTFYFTVDPFEFTDINNINYSNTSFEGELTSGIFPVIRHPLVIREDNSLGFVQKSPEEGYPIYNGAATYYNDVDLSWQGLLGNGDLEYLTSRSSSPRFTFLPDIAHGKTVNFIVNKSLGEPKYPGVELGTNTDFLIDGAKKKGLGQLYFVPGDNRLTICSTQGKFRMFPTELSNTGYECDLNGALNVTPTGLWGTGRVDIDHKLVKMEGNYMTFDDHQIFADTAFFRTEAWSETAGHFVPDFGELRKDIVVRHPDSDDNDTKGRRRKYYESEYRLAYNHAKGRNEALKENMTFETIAEAAYKRVMERRMSSCIDFEKRQGEFKFSDHGNDMSFKEVKYETNVKFFTWGMEQNEITIGQRGSEGNRFYSTAEGDYDEEERLNFLVPVAIYTGSELHCEEVKEVLTADARVKLTDKMGKLIVRAANTNKSKIDRLDSTIVEIAPKDSAGRNISYHVIYNAKTRIDGAQSYQSWGDFDFLNADKKKYTIYMDSIGTDVNRRTKRGTTYAWGGVGEDITFDQYFAYKGKVGIQAGRQLLEFNGGARPIHESPYVTKGYVRFRSVIDPEKVRIPIGERILNWKYGEIERGFFRTYDSTHVYSAFLETRNSKGDKPIAQAYGVLYYNKIFDRFDIAPEVKIEKPDTTGNVLSFLYKEHTIEASGLLDLQTTLPPLSKHGVDLDVAGIVRHERPTNNVEMNAVLAVKTETSVEIATRMYQIIMASQAKTCDTTSYRYEKRMNELYDTAYINHIKRTRWTGLVKNPKTEEQLLPEEDSPTFTFSDVLFHWQTAHRSWVCDTTVNLMMMHNRNVNRQIRLKCEIKIFKDNSDMNMYLDLGDDTWLFLRFKNKLFLYSSDADFNRAIVEAKNKRMSQGNKKYVLKWLSDFENNYRNMADQAAFYEEEELQDEEEEEEENEEQDAELNEEEEKRDEYDE